MRRGFTLIEVLVTIAIIGAMLVTSQAIRLGAPLVLAAKNQDLALKIAQHEVELLRAGGYSNLPPSGTFSDTLLASLPSGAGTLTVSTYNPKTKQIVVAVSWSEKGSARSVSLTTLITEIGGLP
jgi:prepilin-type N-terminal cleavage/methylation domain-containing protein